MGLLTGGEPQKSWGWFEVLQGPVCFVGQRPKVPGGMADRPCLLCWPEAKKALAESSSEEEASTGSSSSDTDSEMDSRKAPEEPFVGIC